MEPTRITIDPEAIEKNNLTLGEFILVLAAYWKVDLDEAAHHMLRMGTARNELGLVLPNQIAIEKFHNAIADSAAPQISEEDLLDLAKKMKTVYPKGMKPGTTTYWAEGPQIIARRLRLFIKKYGEYSAEDILGATQKYVKEMTGNMFMRTLKNFIFTEDYSGNNNFSSDLYNWLENSDEPIDTPNSDWTANVK